MTERRLRSWASALALTTVLIPVSRPSGEAPSGLVRGPAAPVEPLPAEPKARVDVEPCRGCPVVLISVDTLRADHLGCYGYDRDTSPNIDAFAAQSVRFARAYSTSYVTADSHMSMFTSLYPSVHGVKNANGGVIVPLASNIRTLGEIFAGSGYATGAFTGGGNMSGEFGFARGMQRYEIIEDAEQSVDAALHFVRAHSDEPFFLFWHNYHVHDPYLPRQPVAEWLPHDYRGAIETRPSELARGLSSVPFAQWRSAYWSRVNKESAEDVAYLESLYDSEILEVDTALGRLFAGLRSLVPRAVIVFTSDHGEQFGEHGSFLHNALHEELLRVPLLVSYPGMDAGRTVPTPVSLIDLAPTFVDLVGIEAPAQFQGASLLDVVRGERQAIPIFSEKAGVRQSLVLEGMKTVRHGERTNAYDLLEDPQELFPLSPRDPRIRSAATELARTLEHNRAARRRLEAVDGSRPLPGAVPPRALEQLRALGYAQ